MKKYLLLLLSLLVISCGKDSESERVIKFWHFWSEPNQKEALTKLIKKFETENNCKVELTELSWNDGKTKLIAAFNSKTAPDVLELGSDWVAQFSSTGVLAGINKDSAELSKYVDFSTAPSYWNGEIFALPWVLDTRVLYFNKDLLTSAGRDVNPPATFDELLEMSRAMHLGNNIFGFGANGSDPHRLYKKILPFMWSFGGDVFDQNGRLVLYSQENVAALSYYAELSKAGMIETQRQLDAAFIQGKISFWISGSWLVEKIKNENPKLNFGVSLLPGKEPFKGISFAGGEYLAISAQSKKKDLALKFAKFLTDGKNAVEFSAAVSEAGFPADKKYYNDKSLLKNEYKAAFAQQLAYSKMTPVHPNWLEFEEIIENATVEVIYGKIGADTALRNAHEAIENIIKSNKAKK